MLTSNPSVLPSSRRLLGFLTLSLAATVAWDIGEFGIPTNARTAQDLGNEGYRRLWAGDSPGAIAAFRQALVEDPEFNTWLEKRTPMGRWGELEELGGAAIFLASNASRFVNGHILNVDGALLATV